MSNQTTRTIDELGRINLPTELRQELDWDIGDEINLSGTNGTIVLQLSKRYTGPLCVICSKPERKVRIKNRDICDVCLTCIKAA